MFFLCRSTNSWSAAGSSLCTASKSCCSSLTITTYDSWTESNSKTFTWNHKDGKISSGEDAKVLEEELQFGAGEDETQLFVEFTGAVPAGGFGGGDIDAGPSALLSKIASAIY